MIRKAWEAAGVDLDQWLARKVGLRIRLAAAPYMVGWGYSLGSPRVAYPSPGVPESLVGGERVTNCSTLTASLVTSVFADRPWTSREYGDLQVFADRLPDSPDAPIRAAVRMDVAIETESFVAKRWHIVQGWRSLGAKPSGHAFLVRAGEDAESLLVLEATSRGGGIGPRYLSTTASALRKEYGAGLFLGVLSRD
jgi:hypothetical protein